MTSKSFLVLPGLAGVFSLANMHVAPKRLHRLSSSTRCKRRSEGTRSATKCALPSSHCVLRRDKSRSPNTLSHTSSPRLVLIHLVQRLSRPAFVTCYGIILNRKSPANHGSARKRYHKPGSEERSEITLFNAPRQGCDTALRFRSRPFSCGVWGHERQNLALYRAAKPLW